MKERNIMTFNTHKNLINGIKMYNNVTYSNSINTHHSFNIGLSFNDIGRENLMYHYYHFIEYILSVFYIIQTQHIKNEEVEIVLFPNNDDDIFNGNHQDHKYLILKALFPNLKAIHLNNTELQNSNIKTLYEIKRHDFSAVKTSKMNEQLFSKISQPVINIQVEKILNYFNIIEEKKHDNTFQLTYVARKNTLRIFSDEDERQLIKTISNINDVSYKKVYFEELSFKDQIRIAYNTDIMIGIHGNGLTHSLFMKPHKTLIEIFPEGFFAYDYMSIAAIKQDKYYSMYNDRLLTLHEYEQYKCDQNKRVKFATSDRLKKLIEISTVFTHM